jgi:hypothetical protein
VAGHFGEEATAVTLTTPEGSVTVSGTGAGLLVWEKGSVSVEAIGNPHCDDGMMKWWADTPIISSSHCLLIHSTSPERYTP